MSRFVSGGTIDAATGHAVSAEPGQPASSDGGGKPAGSNKRQGEWEAVSRELEEQRRRREEEARRAATEGGEKSLFAILQENKAAKQAAFEEANKIKNQFRALDDDEVEFLEEVQASTRREEERTRREVQEGLDRFREAQRRGERQAAASAAAAAATDSSAAADASKEASGDFSVDRDADAAEEDWAVGGAGRKRRRKDDGRAGALKGVLRRKTSEPKPAAAAQTAATKEGPGPGSASPGEGETASVSKAPPKPVVTPAAAAKPSVGLVDYGSDDDSD